MVLCGLWIDGWKRPLLLFIILFVWGNSEFKIHWNSSKIGWGLPSSLTCSTPRSNDPNRHKCVSPTTSTKNPRPSSSIDGCWWSPQWRSWRGVAVNERIHGSPTDRRTDETNFLPFTFLLFSQQLSSLRDRSSVGMRFRARFQFLSNLYFYILKCVDVCRCVFQCLGDRKCPLKKGKPAGVFSRFSSFCFMLRFRGE